MLIDGSARVWAMRRDGIVASQALQERADRNVEGQAPGAFGRGELLDGSDFARVVNGVAVIPVKGPLMRAMSYWMWSYEEIARDLALAQASPAVRSIVLDIDSPGGLVAGCSDLAAEIFTSGPKPIEAFVGGMAASAAYWLASAADRITLGSGAIVGSIGSVIEFVDMEPMFEKMGAKMVRVVAEQSPNKRLDPHSPEGQAEMQALVDASGAEFVLNVAAFRGKSEAEVMERFGQGLVFDGAEAIARGMADGRGTLDQIIAGLAGRNTTINAAPAAAAQETPMDWANLTLAALREHRADLVGEIEATATTAATETDKAAVAKAERDRILGLDEVAVAGHEKLVADAKADGKTTPAELALQIIKADKASGTNFLAERSKADSGAAVTPVQPSNTTTTLVEGTVEEKAKAEWDKDAALQAEFGGKFDTYLAFAKATQSGRAKILSRG